MNFSQLEALVALADTRSFTEASELVNLTQSAVSHSLAALEQELGVTLIERNRKGIIGLTSVGQKVLPHVRALLTQAEAIEQEAKTAKGIAGGKLRLGSIVSIISPTLLAGALTAFQQHYPDIEVVLFEGTMPEIWEWLENSVIDVGFALYTNTCHENRLLLMDELCVVLSTNHRYRALTALSPDALSEESFIMAKSECTLQLLKTAGIPVTRQASIRFQATDSSTIFAMVREGLGITLLPRMALPKKLEGMIALPLDPPQFLQIGLVLGTREPAPPSTKLFVESTSQWLQQQHLYSVPQLTPQ